MRRRKNEMALAPLAQGVFYTLTGLWPILNLRSFEAITGPKADRWLVKTIGGLIAVVGLSLTVGSGVLAAPMGRRRARAGSAETALGVLGIGSALSLALADVVYVWKGRISRIYLADAVTEVGIAAAWAVSSRSRRGSRFS